MRQEDHYQRTVVSEVSFSGVGLHSGKEVQVKVKPAPINHGIKFMRADLPSNPTVAARFNKVVDTSLATVIGEDGFIVSTIEHLMAAFAGLRIDNALVETTAYELPMMDGSAGPFVRALKKAGVRTQSAPQYCFIIEKPIVLEEKEKFVGVYPAPHFRVTCTIEFPNSALIQTQTLDVVVTPALFERQIAEARTFCFLQEVEQMKKFGLGQGGSLENAIVIDQDKILNEGGLRFADEFVRHKVLDCIGDFSLIGLPIRGHVVLKRSGHAFNNAFLEKFFMEKGSWETRTIEDVQPYTPTLPLKRLAN